MPEPTDLRAPLREVLQEERNILNANPIQTDHHIPKKEKATPKRPMGDNDQENVAADPSSTAEKRKTWMSALVGGASMGTTAAWEGTVRDETNPVD